MNDFKLRAVVSGLDAGYVVSISNLSKDGENILLCEEEVDSLLGAHALMTRIAKECDVSASEITKLYNIGGKITDKPPRGRL